MYTNANHGGRRRHFSPAFTVSLSLKIALANDPQYIRRDDIARHGVTIRSQHVANIMNRINIRRADNPAKRFFRKRVSKRERWCMMAAG